MLTKLRYIILLPAVAAGIMAMAQQTDASLLDSINARLSKVEATQTQLRRTTFLPTVSGYTQVGYNYNEDITSEFYVKCARFDVKGNIGTKIDYRILFDIYKFKCFDVRLSYKPLRQLHITAGYFKVPFTIGAGRGPLTEEFIDYPLAIRRLTGYTDVCGITGGTARDIGVSLSGTLWQHRGVNVLSYAVGVFNGNSSNAKDDNTSKDVAAKLSVRPIKELEISASAYMGEYGPKYLKRNRWSTGMEYAGSLILARAEYIGGSTGTISATDGSRGTFHSDGYYAQIGVKTPCRLTPLIRYDAVVADTRTDMTESIASAGALWQPMKHLRLQGVYSRYFYRNTPGNTDHNQVHIVVTALF